MIELTLPYPPSVNHYKVMGRLKQSQNGKIYREMVNSPETKRFYYEVFMLVRQKPPKSFDSATISIDLDVCPPDARKRDIDNVAKPVLDALQKAGLYNDDNQVSRLLIQRCPIISQGQIIVRISEYAFP